MWYVYILELSNWRWYTWSTIDITTRILQHEKGEVNSTKNVRPVTLLYMREFQTIQQARQVEYWLKKQKSKRILQMFMDDILVLPSFRN